MNGTVPGRITLTNTFSSDAPKLRAIAPSLGRDLETIVARCLERDPKARYQSAAALAKDLERWLEGRPIVARPVRAPTRVWRWSRRNPILAGAVTGCLLLALAVAWLVRREQFIVPRTPALEKSVAVLPLMNLGDPNDAYLADGITEDLIDGLSMVPGIKVRAPVCA